MADILKVSNLSVSFDKKKVIDSLSFELDEGDDLAIIGPNGAGKSVLLRALFGLVPHDGEVAWRKGVHIGYVPQKIDADRHLPINVKNLFEAKADALGVPQKDVAAAVASVGLSLNILETPLGHLSGGQFQRTLIAFALIGKPNVLILDEPTASIDRPGEEKMYELIHRLQDQFGMTIILVSHDLSFVYRYATKVLCLNRSGVCFGAPDEALTPELLDRLYGGPMKHYHHFHDNA